MAKIFISYRRSDSQHAVDRLQGAMKPYVKNAKRDIFVDVDNIPIGHDFEEHLQGKVSECDALLAVIGPDWLSNQKEDGTRRLDDPEDFVRTEIVAALSRNIPVVPVLLDGAQVPHASQLPDNLKPLAKRNGAQLDRKSFAADVDHIMTGLGLAKKEGGAGKWLTGAAAAVVLGALGWFGWMEFGGGISAPEAEFVEVDDAPDVVEIVDAEPEPFSESVEDAEYREDLIARYQEALTELEFYDGPIDGLPGTATNDASTDFVRAHDRTNLGLDFANLDALERLVIYAEDTVETRDLNRQKLEEQQAEAEAQLELDLAAKRDAAEADMQREIDAERQAALGKARRDAEAEGRRLAAIEAAKPDWAKGLSGQAKVYADKCLNGSMFDCNEIGATYFGIHPTAVAPQNYAHARTLYTKACDGGRMAGCNGLGNLYNEGHGVSVDYVRARTLYTKACNGGNMFGCNGLGNLYYDGNGVAVDRVRSKQLHQKACDGGSAKACEILRDFY